MSINHLKAAMALRGINDKTLCAMIGMPISTWYRKIGNGEFDRKEIADITNALHLTMDELRNIFFPGVLE